MSYNFTQAGNVMNIEEQQYGSAGEIRFSKFTSCIGLIARNGNNVTGVHLVMVSSDDTYFDNAAADAAIRLLGNYQQVVVIGYTATWAANLLDPYQHLIAGLRKPVIIENEKDNGKYGGRVKNGVFQTYQNGTYVNV